MTKVVGLDIGSYGVRAVQCVGSNRKLNRKIVKAAEVKLPKGAVIGGEVKNIEEVAEALRILWKEEKFGKGNVVIGVTGDNTIVRQVQLPWEPEGVFRGALPLRLGNELPVDPFEVSLDYYPLEEKIVKSTLIQDALVVGVLHATVDRSERACKEAKLTVRRADYDPFALLRATQYLRGVKIEEIEDENEIEQGQVVVSVGGQVTEVVIHQGGKPLFVRTSVVGSEAVTKALSEKLHVPFEAAEQLKCDLGLEGLGTQMDIEQMALEYGIHAKLITPAREIINHMAGALVQNVRDTVEYYLNLSTMIYGINRVSLAGGGILLPGYAKRLAGELRSDVEILDPLSTFGSNNVKNDSFLIGPKFVTAYGLAVNP